MLIFDLKWNFFKKQGTVKNMFMFKNYFHVNGWGMPHANCPIWKIVLLCI